MIFNCYISINSFAIYYITYFVDFLKTAEVLLRSISDIIYCKTVYRNVTVKNHLSARLVVYLLAWDFSVSLIAWMCYYNVTVLLCCLSKHLIQMRVVSCVSLLDTYVSGRTCFYVLSYLRKLEKYRPFHFFSWPFLQ